MALLGMALPTLRRGFVLPRFLGLVPGLTTGLWWFETLRALAALRMDSLLRCRSFRSSSCSEAFSRLLSRFPLTLSRRFLVVLRSISLLPLSIPIFNDLSLFLRFVLPRLLDPEL